MAQRISDGTVGAAMGNARTKLNSAFFNGAFITGIGLGALTGSVVLGLIGFLVILALAVHSGDIRLTPTNKGK